MMKYNFRLSEIDISTIFSSSNAPRRQKGLEQEQFFCLRVLFFAELQWHLSFKEGRRKFSFAYFIRSQFIPRLFQRVSLYLCIEMLVMPKQENPLSNDVIIFIDHGRWFSRDIKPCSHLHSKAVILPTNLFNYLRPPTTRPASKMSNVPCGKVSHAQRVCFTLSPRSQVIDCQDRPIIGYTGSWDARMRY